MHFSKSYVGLTGANLLASPRAQRIRETWIISERRSAHPRSRQPSANTFLLHCISELIEPERYLSADDDGFGAETLHQI